jgi:hypothetical protein
MIRAYRGEMKPSILLTELTQSYPQLGTFLECADDLAYAQAQLSDKQRGALEDESKARALYAIGTPCVACALIGHGQKQPSPRRTRWSPRSTRSST